MKHTYFVKFEMNRNVERFTFETLEEMLHYLKEFMMRNQTGHIEWLIRE